MDSGVSKVVEHLSRRTVGFTEDERKGNHCQNAFSSPSCATHGSSRLAAATSVNHNSGARSIASALATQNSLATHSDSRQNNSPRPSTKSFIGTWPQIPDRGVDQRANQQANGSATEQRKMHWVNMIPPDQPSAQQSNGETACQREGASVGRSPVGA